MSSLENYTYFIQNLSEYMKEHYGKYVVIADGNERGFFDSFDDAYVFAAKEYGLGNFLIQQCVSEQESTSTFYSPLYRL